MPETVDGVLAAAQDITNRSPYAFFTSIDKDTKYPQTRLVQPFLLEADADGEEGDLVVYIGTHKSTRKVQDIEADARVSLAYQDNDSIGYTVLKGEAAVVENKSLREKYWRDDWFKFYPNREDEYILIKVKVNVIEVSSEAHKIANTPSSWKPAILTRRDNKWHLLHWASRW